MSFPYFARIVLLAFVTVFASAAQAQAQAQEPECADLHPDWSIEGETPTTVSAKDLVLLRDFGAVYPLAAQSPFGVSPDGQRIAIQLRQARPSSNTYCLGLFVIDRHADEPPALIDDGGDLVFPRPNHQGLGSFPVGHQQVIVPRWSPNGQSVAYLKREDGSTQVYVVSGDGSGGRFVTSSETDVEEFVWSPDGQEVIYATPAELVAAEAAILEEGRRGWRYDGRFHPLTQSRPYPAPIASEYRAAHLRTGAERPATEEEARRLNAETRSGRVVNSRENPVVWNHGIAWGGRLDQEVRLSPYRLQFRSGSGEDIICEFEACRSGAVGLWPSEDGRELYYLRREGPASSRFALYRFLSPHDEPQKIFETEDALSGCQMVAADLICGRETSLSPRSLVAIEPNSGRSTVLFDPNPEFRQRRLSRPTRLYWTNDAGEDAFGDLILPPDHREGDRHPLVVVGYSSIGFLRGGTGDEYPIQALVSRGFAVLSYNRPVTTAPPTRSGPDLNRQVLTNWRDRRSDYSALMAGLDLVIAQGVIDPDRIGLTGFSDGVSAAQFALLASDRFAAAALSGCCDDPVTSLTTAGPRWANETLIYAGYPPLSAMNTDHWRPMSLYQNADRVRTPLLINAADSEYLRALNTFQALVELNKPVDLFVFPDEHHVKWQPAHRLAIYERNLAWFDFWLRDVSSDLPHMIDDVSRWGAMRRGEQRTF